MFMTDYNIGYKSVEEVQRVLREHRDSDDSIKFTSYSERLNYKGEPINLDMPQSPGELEEEITGP